MSHLNTVEPRYNIKVGNHLFFYYIEVFYYNEFFLISYKCNIFDISVEFMVYTRCAISVYDLKYSDIHFWFVWACLWGFFNDLCFFSIRECLSRFFSWHDVSETTKWWLNHIKPATVMASEKANRHHYSVNVNFLFYEKWHFSSIFGAF